VSDLMTDWKIPFLVQRMAVQDIPEVMAIEKKSFPLSWSATAYRHELTQNDHSHYIVVRKREPPRVPPHTRRFDRWFRRPEPHRPPVIGYGGFWILGEEAHISTIAVHPNWRGRGIGELLLVAMVKVAAALDAQVVTLEVRVSNVVAQNLYRKYLFEKVGRRRRYYRDNNEDALIMTTPRMDDPVFVEVCHRHRAALSERLRKVGDKRFQEGTDHKR
jgi:ribosomal-protein-alanine N-acetyltransferase